MTLLVWLGLGMLLGIIASRLIPKMEFSNAFFAFVIAIVGAIFGGFAASIMGYNQILASGGLAVIGSLTVLFFYKHYLTDTVSH